MSAVVSELRTTVPANWAVCRLGEVTKVSSGTTPSRSDQTRYFDGGSIPWVKTGDLNNGLVKTTEEQITETAVEECSVRLYPPDTVLVAMYGGFRQIGRTGRLATESAINQALSALQPKNGKLDSSYLQAWLNEKVKMWKRFAASSRKDPNITGSDVAAFPIAFPPLPEQRMIAATLSTWDRAIELTEKLIAAKQKRTQALMQQLLTGKVRSPEFGTTSGNETLPVGWEVVSICDVARLESGHTPDRTISDYWNGSIPWVSLHDTGQLDSQAITDTAFSVTELGIRNSSARVLPKGTVVFSRTATVGKATTLGREMATSQDFANYICGPRLLNHYLVFLLRSMKRTWTRLMAGSTHSTIYMPDFKKLSITLPPFNEQLAITELLESCEHETRLLRAKRRLFLQQKKGLMQQLLAGRVHVVVDAEMAKG